ncbi:PepSY domain-containing protein [Gammaproteobacteria bacterium]|nr:PepSY domain-containing protein [Gammaproteobacteria bacterium]
MIIKIHRFLGITLVVFLLILSITGTLLQHAEDFGIRKKFISSTLVSNLYNIKPCEVASTKLENKWISLCDGNLYFQQNKIINNINSVNTVYKKNDNYIIQYNDSHEIMLNDLGVIIDMKHLDKLSTKKLKKIKLKSNGAPENLRKKIENISISKTITYERVAVDIHTGRLIGIVGITLVDLVTMGLIILSFTGTYSWFRHKKIF